MNNSAFRTATIAVLALLSGALIAAALVLARGDGNAPIQVITPDSTNTTESTRLVDASPGPTQADLRVYINGAVQNPGVYQMKPGDRLADGLAAAGGATDEADLASVNLAQRVQDEGYYYLPREGETPPSVAALPGDSNPPENSGSSSGARSADGLIDVNSASAQVLATLPNIGPVKAQAIVAYRDRNGPFASIEDLTQVAGIGSSNFETIRNLVTASPP